MLVILVFLLPPIVALVLAVVVGAGVTAWRRAGRRPPGSRASSAPVRSIAAERPRLHNVAENMAMAVGVDPLGCS